MKISGFVYLINYVKYAYQRVTRGYDDVAVMDLDKKLRLHILKLLIQFRKKNDCLFTVGDVNKLHEIIDEFDCEKLEKDSYGRIYLNELQTDMVLRKMISCFKMMDSEYVSKILIEKKKYGAYQKNSNDEDYKLIQKIIKINREKAFTLLEMFYDQLWL